MELHSGLIKEFEKTKHPGKVMVWLGACAKGLTTPVIFGNGTTNAEVYINEVLPIALECGDKMLGSNSTYQQDSARPHIHYLTQEDFHDFISKKRWPPNSPDLCPNFDQLSNTFIRTRPE